MTSDHSAPSAVPLEITVQDAHRQLEEGGVRVRLIDVRDPEEFAFNRLPGAQQLGYLKARSIAGGVDKWSTEIDPKVPRY